MHHSPSVIEIPRPIMVYLLLIVCTKYHFNPEIILMASANTLFTDGSNYTGEDVREIKLLGKSAPNAKDTKALEKHIKMFA